MGVSLIRLPVIVELHVFSHRSRHMVKCTVVHENQRKGRQRLVLAEMAVSLELTSPLPPAGSVRQLRHSARSGARPTRRQEQDSGRGSWKGSCPEPTQVCKVSRVCVLQELVINQYTFYTVLVVTCYVSVGLDAPGLFMIRACC